MEVTPEELQQRIQELSDDELLVMVNDDPSQLPHGRLLVPIAETTISVNSQFFSIPAGLPSSNWIG